MSDSSFFPDDSIDVRATQYEVYHKALWVIRDECRKHMLLAAGLLGVDPPPCAMTTAPVNHHAMTAAYQYIAAAWRYRSNASQPRLPFLRGEPDLMKQWFSWLRIELESWRERPYLVRQLMIIVEHCDTPRGFRAEDALTIALISRYDDVPWSARILKLQAELIEEAEKRELT